jgi:hypothetical protein
MKIVKRVLFLTVMLFAGINSLQAYTFEIRVQPASGSNITVEMRQTDAGNSPTTSNTVQDLTFGIYWDNNYGVNLGTLANKINTNVTKSGSETLDGTGTYEYQVFTITGSFTIPSNWTDGAWKKIFDIPVSGGTGTGSFFIMDDIIESGTYQPFFQIDLPGPTYSDYYIGNNLSINGSASGVPLPVTLTHFDVTAQGQTDAKLTWQTATEMNNRGFYVERSVDGKSWNVVNFVPTLTSDGNSKILTNYQYLDVNVYKSWNGISTYYYRLRQQDMNGVEEYVGGIKAIHFGGDQAAAVVSVFPNPASQFLNITVKNGVAARYAINDMAGRPVAGGTYASRISVANLRSGNYQVRVYDITGSVLGTQQVILAR